MDCEELGRDPILPALRRHAASRSCQVDLVLPQAQLGREASEAYHSLGHWSSEIEDDETREHDRAEELSDTAS